VAEDPAESTNVAAEDPDRLRELIALWWDEAAKYKVLPLDGSLQARLAVERPQTSKPRTRYVYYPGGAVVPAFAAPPVFNRPYSIEADVEIPAGGAEGVLVAQGGDAAATPFTSKRAACITTTTTWAETASSWHPPTRSRTDATRCAMSSSLPGNPTSATARVSPAAASCMSTATWSPTPSSRTRSRSSSSSRGSAAATTSAHQPARPMSHHSNSPERSKASPSTSQANSSPTTRRNWHGSWPSSKENRQRMAPGREYGAAAWPRSCSC
jgi:hypothetical protein